MPRLVFDSLKRTVSMKLLCLFLGILTAQEAYSQQEMNFSWIGDASFSVFQNQYEDDFRVLAVGPSSQIVLSDHFALLLQVQPGVTLGAESTTLAFATHFLVQTLRQKIEAGISYQALYGDQDDDIWNSANHWGVTVRALPYQFEKSGQRFLSPSLGGTLFLDGDYALEFGFRLYQGR